MTLYFILQKIWQDLDTYRTRKFAVPCHSHGHSYFSQCAKMHRVKIYFHCRISRKGTERERCAQIRNGMTRSSTAEDVGLWESVYQQRAARLQTKALPFAAPIKYDNSALSQQRLMDFLWVCLVIAWPMAPWPLSGSWQTRSETCRPPGLEKEAPYPHMTEGAGLPHATVASRSFVS